MTDSTNWSLAEAAAALRRRAISSRELTDACLARIARADPALRIFVHVEAAFARDAAARADRRLTQGMPESPLLGIPIARKDNIDRHGQIATAGSRAFRDRRPERTAAVLARLDRAGAIDLGGTSLSEFAFHVHGVNGLMAPPANPWDVARIAGASSGGSGAGLAARCFFGALGTDSGGSIRNPAAFCGLYGLLPTRGAVSRDGLVRTGDTVDAIGPMARTAEDCALLFAAMRDEPAAGSAPPALRGARVRILSDVRLAALPAGVARALDRAASFLGEDGVRVAPVAFGELDAFNALAALVFLHEAAAAHGTTLRDRWDAVHPAIRERLIGGLAVPPATYARALAAQKRALRHFLDAVLGDAEALLLPTVPGPPPRFAELDAPPALDPGLFTRFANYLGVPALALPAGQDKDGLPLSVQLVGRPDGEAALFALAAALEHRFGRLPPPSCGLAP